MNKPQKLNPKTGQPYPADLAVGYYGPTHDKNGNPIESTIKVKISINIDELIAQFGTTGTALLTGFDATVDKDGNPRQNLKDTSPHLRFVKTAQKPAVAAAPARGRASAPARAGGKGGGGYPF